MSTTTIHVQIVITAEQVEYFGEEVLRAAYAQAEHIAAREIGVGRWVLAQTDGGFAFCEVVAATDVMWRRSQGVRWKVHDPARPRNFLVDVERADDESYPSLSRDVARELGLYAGGERR